MHRSCVQPGVGPALHMHPGTRNGSPQKTPEAFAQSPETGNNWGSRSYTNTRREPVGSTMKTAGLEFIALPTASRAWLFRRPLSPLSQDTPFTRHSVSLWDSADLVGVWVTLVLTIQGASRGTEGAPHRRIRPCLPSISLDSFLLGKGTGSWDFKLDAEGGQRKRKVRIHLGLRLAFQASLTRFHLLSSTNSGLLVITFFLTVV